MAFVKLGVLSAEALERIVRANENKRKARLTLVESEPRSAGAQGASAAGTARAREHQRAKRE
jgi:hypothetical protein